MEKTYYVYIMASFSGVLYIGMTNNIQRRVAEHKSLLYQSFTKKYRVVRLLYLEVYSTPMYAIEREKQLKGWTRRKKLDLIKEHNPFLKDIAQEL